MTFLENFRSFTSCSEVHESHAIWAGLCALASIVGKRVKVNMGHFEVYPNMYVVFVAPPGGRKSTAMDFAGRFLEELQGIPVALDCVTKEAIVGAMVGCEQAFTLPDKTVFSYSPLTIMATEMSEFIGASKEGMVSFLTAIYDKRGNYTYKTIKRGEETIVNPCLNLLGCTTPAWITARLRDDVISGGFSRRAVFVYETTRARRVAFPTVTDELKQAWQDALEYAKELKNVYGTFEWTEPAKRYFKDWYENLEIPSDPMLIGYYETKHMQLLKVAQLIALSESTDLKLEESHLVQGLRILNAIERNLHRVFEGVGRNELHSLAATLQELIRVAGGSMPEKKVLATMFAHGNEGEIRQVIDHLLNAEKLIRVPTPGKVHGTFINHLKLNETR